MKRKILVYALTGQMGGIESFFKEYIKYISDVHFDFIALDETVAFGEHWHEQDCQIFKVPRKSRDLFGYYRRLKEIFSKARPQYDAVWFNDNNLGDIYFLKLARSYNIPVRICHAHNARNRLGMFRKLRHEWNRKNIFRVATDFWACSELAGEWFYGKKDNIKIIPNAIDAKRYRFDPQIREETARELGVEDKFVIGHVGRFTEQKNHSFLLDVFSQVAAEKTNSVLLLVGDGELRRRMEEKVKNLGLADKVIFLGERTDVNRILQIMDVFAFPSLYEGLSIALLEVQAAGIPAIVSETVSKEVKVTEAIYFLPLDKGTNVWTEKILNIEPLNRQMLNQCFAESKYNMEVSGENMKKWFEEKMR